jgi:hypothetical protein
LVFDYKGEREIVFIVMDEDMFEDDVIGGTKLNVDDFYRAGKFSGLLRLDYKNKKAGELYVEIELNKPV